MPTLFITATDTGAGKTRVTGLLAKTLYDAGHTVVTQKWVQTGLDGEEPDLAVHDRWSGLLYPESVGFARCPYGFGLAASPHLASEQVGIEIDPAVLAETTKALQSAYDWVLIEGSGGVLCPLTRNRCIIDSVAELHIPALLVVKNQVGCLNHTALSLEALKYRGISVLGAIVSDVTPNTPDFVLDDNALWISHHTPLLSRLAYGASTFDAPQRVLTALSGFF
ncbi:MAG: dethiobiotin synthase [Candidatus Margulisiibacteriota bacterium]